MLWFAAAAIAASTPAPPSVPAPVAVQATATVRIISGIRLKLYLPTNTNAPPAHDGTVTTGGVQQPARLIEFQ